MKQMLIVKTFLLVLVVLMMSFLFENTIFFNSIDKKNIVLAGNIPPLLFATNISPNSITLDWIDNLIGETGFKVERKIGNCSNSNPFEQIRTLGANTTSFTDYNVSFGSFYCYRIRAFLDTLNSSYSNEISVFVSEGDSLFSFSAKPSSIDFGEQSKLTWSANGSLYCIASEGWNGEKPISTSQMVSPEKTTSYTISCIWSDKTVISKSVVVEVIGSKDEFGKRNYCYRNNFSVPLFQSSCPIAPDNSSHCKLDLSDGFSLNVSTPYQAVDKKANLQILVHNLEDFKNLSDNLGNDNLGNLKIIGNRIIQISVKDENCQKVNLLKEIAIGFSYPQSYANNFDENSFVIKKAEIEDNSWNNVLNKKNISSNIIVGIDKELGYFSLFGSKKYVLNNVSSSKIISSKPPVINCGSSKNNLSLNSAPPDSGSLNSGSLNPETSELSGEPESSKESNKRESFFKYLLASLANQARQIGWKLAVSVSIIFSLILITWFLYKRKLFKRIAFSESLNVSNLYNNRISDIKNRIKKKKHDAVSVSSISFEKEKRRNEIIEKNGDVLIIREV